MREGTVRRSTLVFFWILLALIAALLLRDPALCARLVKDGGAVVLKKALPSIFPYLILSSLFFESGLPALFCGRMGRWLGRLLHLPAVCISGVVMGFLAGFPLGARFAAGLYRQGYCTKEQAERASALSGFCAPPFLLGAFGAGVMGDLRAGVLLYLVQTAVVLLYGVILGRLAAQKEGGRKEGRCGDEKDRSENDGFLNEPLLPSSLSLTVGRSIGASALQMVSISGYILTFSLLSGLIIDIFEPFLLHFPAFKCLVAGFFEISSGVAHMRDRGAFGMLLGALCLSWSGLSVHMQVAGVLAAEGLSVKEHLRAHLCLCPIIAALCALFCGALDLF